MTTATRATHTPGRVEVPGKDGGDWVICTEASRGKRRTVAHAYTAEDAARLARCWNCRDELLDMVKELQARHFATHGNDDLYERADALIDRATA